MRQNKTMHPLTGCAIECEWPDGQEWPVTLIYAELLKHLLALNHERTPLRRNRLWQRYRETYRR
jgi:hypothetical protein